MKKNILDNLRSVLLSRGSFDSYPPSVWQAASSLNTYGTNAIEGNSLTQEDVNTVIIDRSGVKKPINFILETIQHESAFRHLLARKARAIDLVTLLELHEEVFRGLLPDYGQWRKVNVMIRGASFTPPRYEKLVGNMEVLMKEYDQRDISGEDVFTLAAWFHYNFERIHPFSDGNGRVGRLLLNLHFLRHNWPPVNIMPVDQDRYLDALGRGNEGDLMPLNDYLRSIMGGSLLNFLSYVGTGEDELKPLGMFGGESPYSAKYLSLRARQGELPAVLTRNDWHTSQRAIRLYIEMVGRK
jgi:Fic family protein